MLPTFRKRDPAGAAAHRTASLRKHIVAHYLGQGIAGLLSVAFIPVYLRLLGAEGYGVIGLFTLLQAWLLIIDMTISMTLGREIARYVAGVQSTASIRTFVRSAELLTLCLALSLGGAVAAGAPWLAEHWLRARTLSPTTLQHAIGLMAIVLALRLFEGLYRGCLLNLHRPVLLNLLTVGVATLRWGGAAACLLWIEASVTAFFAWQCLVSTAASIAYAVAVQRALPSATPAPRPSAQALWNVRMFFTATLATYALGFVVSQADKIILSRISSLDDFGHYAFAAMVASILSMIATPVIQALYPRLTVQASQGHQQRLADTYHFGAQLLNVALAPPALVLIFFGPEFVAAWTGDSATAARAGPMVQILAFGTLLNGYMGLPHMLQLAHGWAGLSARINMVAVVVLVPVIAFIAPRYGAEGTAWAWVALNAGYVVAGIPAMHLRLLPQDMRQWYWNDTIRPAFAAAAPFVVSSLAIPPDLGRLATWAWLAATALLGLMSAVLCAPRVRQRSLDALRAVRAARA